MFKPPGSFTQLRIVWSCHCNIYGMWTIGMKTQSKSVLTRCFMKSYCLPQVIRYLDKITNRIKYQKFDRLTWLLSVYKSVANQFSQGGLIWIIDESGSTFLFSQPFLVFSCSGWKVTHSPILFMDLRAASLQLRFFNSLFSYSQSWLPQMRDRSH